MEKRSYIGIGLLGLGVVGSGVARVLWKRADMFAEQLGRSLSLRKVLVRHPAKHRDLEVEPHLLTTSFDDVLSDPTVDIVIEVMGGESPAKDYI